jgi:hypothetical protein
MPSNNIISTSYYLAQQQNPPQNICYLVALFATFLHVPPLQLQTMQLNNIHSHLYPSLLITVVLSVVDVANKNQGDIIFAI